MWNVVNCLSWNRFLTKRVNCRQFFSMRDAEFSKDLHVTSDVLSNIIDNETVSTEAVWTGKSFKIHCRKLPIYIYIKREILCHILCVFLYGMFSWAPFTNIDLLRLGHGLSNCHTIIALCGIWLLIHVLTSVEVKACIDNYIPPC